MTSPREAFGQAASQIRAMTDPLSAYEAAAELAGDAARFRAEAADLRSEMAARVRDDGGLTLRQLGERIGRGKPTAQKILRRAKKAVEG